jgi:hypothetical protein
MATDVGHGNGLGAVLLASHCRRSCGPWRVVRGFFTAIGQQARGRRAILSHCYSVSQHRRGGGIMLAERSGCGYAAGSPDAALDLSVRVIAKQFGVDPYTVQRIRRPFGRSRKRGGVRRKPPA